MQQRIWGTQDDYKRLACAFDKSVVTNFPTHEVEIKDNTRDSSATNWHDQSQPLYRMPINTTPEQPQPSTQIAGKSGDLRTAGPSGPVTVNHRNLHPSYAARTLIDTRTVHLHSQTVRVHGWTVRTICQTVRRLMLIFITHLYVCLSQASPYSLRLLNIITPLVLRELKNWHVIISTCINLLDILRMHLLGQKFSKVWCCVLGYRT